MTAVVWKQLLPIDQTAVIGWPPGSRVLRAEIAKYREDAQDAIEFWYVRPQEDDPGDPIATFAVAGTGHWIGDDWQVEASAVGRQFVWHLLRSVES